MPIICQDKKLALVLTTSLTIIVANIEANFEVPILVPEDLVSMTNNSILPFKRVPYIHHPIQFKNTKPKFKFL